jgi:hypothetical protein
MTNKERYENISHCKIEKDENGNYPCPPATSFFNCLEWGDCEKCNQWWEQNYSEE